MLRLFPLLLLVGCAATPTGLDLDIAYERAQQAIRAGDGETAHALLAEAAGHDHLPSLAALLMAYADHGFAVPGAWTGTEQVTLPVRVEPARQAVTGFRFVRAISRGVRRGDPMALRYHAMDLAAGGSAEDRAEAERIYRHLLTTDLPARELFALSLRFDAIADQPRLARLAAAEGDPLACTFQVWLQEDDPQTTWSHTAGVARYLDRVGACAPDRPIPAEAVSILRDLQAQLASGAPAAAVAMDSLRTLGVFDRHPELAALVAVDPPATTRSPVPTASAAP